MDHVIWPDGKRLVLIAEGHVANLSMSAQSSFQTSVNSVVSALALIDLFSAPKGKYKNQVYLLPRALDEYTANLHLGQFNSKLTSMTNEQASYLGVNKAGPFKQQFYRY